MASTLGFALGASADARTERINQERQEGQLRQKKLKSVRDNVKALTEQAVALKSSASTPDQIPITTIGNLRKALQEVTTAAQTAFGAAPGLANASVMFDAALQSAKTQQEVAEQEGTSAARAATAQVEALEASGVAPTTAATAAGIGEDAPSVQNFVLPDGTQQGIDMNAPNARQVVDSIISRGGVRVGFNVDAQAPGTFALSKPEIKDFREAEIATRTALSETARMREQLKDGTLTGLAGGVVRELSNAAGSVVQLARQAGIDDTPLLTDQDYSFEAAGEAGKSAAFKSNVINLAYLLARAAEPGGRLSKEDVQLQIDRLGGNVGDQSQIGAALDEVDRALKVSFSSRHAVVSRSVDIGPLPADLNPALQPGFTEQELSTLPEADRVILSKPEDQLTEDDINALSLEGIRALGRKRGLIR